MTSYVSPVAFTTVAQSIPPNVFADMDRKVAAAVADGADVIDLAKGNPDAFPADFIREVAKKAVDDPANARYSPFDGKPSFLQAANSGIATRMVLRLIGKPSFLPWRARLMVSRRCSPCLFRRAMLWHMRIRITPRIIA